MKINLAPKDFDMIAIDMANEAQLSFLSARGMAKRYHPMAEDSAVKILNEYNEEEVRAWWKEQRELNVLTAKIYKKILKKTARRQARVRVSKLLQ